MKMADKSVDIIIPIYNAADDLKICLESIYKNTDLSKNRLVLINDNSSDSRIKEILDSQKRENVIVIHNDKNQGFSANINLGMAQSEENDVILLNSDTVVTDRWVEKMVDCAYSSPEIGTVTPLSNNATLCSVPVFCEENKLPENIDAEKMGRIVEHCSMKKYPRISVAHGFCMLVKREVINLIGNFDAATFGRGYGEENDFCNRAEQVGFIHVQCDDTFILHTGTKSFVSAEKEEYIRKHDMILRKRYPSQMHANDVYVRDNPNGYVQENIKIFMDLENGKKNILYVVHSDFRKGASDNVGGTQLHVRHLKDNLIDEYNVFVAARDELTLNLTLYIDDKEYFWKFNIGEYKGYFRFHDRELKKVWDLVFNAFNIDVVHIHHVCNLSFDIFDCAEERNIPILFTCHDYFFISPSLKMLDADYNIIVKKEMTEEKWRKVLSLWSEIYSETDYISFWQKKCLEILHKCQEIIVPNGVVKDYLVEYYPDISDIIRVVPHGYEFEEDTEQIVINSNYIRHYIESIKKTNLGYVIEGWAVTDDTEHEIEKLYLEIDNGDTTQLLLTSTYSRGDVVGAGGTIGAGFKALVPLSMVEKKVRLSLLLKVDGKYSKEKNVLELQRFNKSNESLNIAFIGGINKEKGGSIICELVKKKTKGVNYYVFGNLGYEELSDLEANNLYKFGKYDSNDLPGILSVYKIDLVCILSIWPETFSYTLSEALLCGIPAIVVDTGALGNRMDNLNAGWKVSINNAGSGISSILDSIRKDHKLLEEKKEIAKKVKLRTMDEMANDYRRIYNSFNCNNYRQEAFDSEYLYKNYVQRSYFVDSENQMANINCSLIGEDKDVLNSLSFRIARRVRKINFPFKRSLWHMLRRKF